MSVVVSHPTGNANVRAVLRALEREGLLERFHTTIALPETGWSDRISQSFDRRLGQRRFPQVPWDKVRLHPAREIVRQVARRCGPAVLVRHETGCASVDAVYAALDRAVAAGLRRDQGPTQAIYAYEDEALESFQAARDLGIFRFYDLPSVHWKTRLRLFRDEAERLPQWAQTLDAIKDSPEKNARKDEELSASDRIFVASTFNQIMLTEHFGTRLSVSVVPYGCPSPLVARPRQRDGGTPLRLFFAGRLTQQKGLADLISALKIISIDWHLTIAGQLPDRPPEELTRFLSDPRCHWLGTVPHRTLLEHMTLANLFVFPSLSEGFGMVITEALAAGLPVITTPHTCGPDILTDSHDGFIVPIRSPEAIAARITQLAENEALRYQMAENALETAANNPWGDYEAAIARIVRNSIGQ